jgi:hypothetical protein
MDYSSYVNAVADLLILLPTIVDSASANPSSDPNFNTILPRAIEYAEQRMYRELDLMQTFTSDSSTITSSNIRSYSVPGNLIVLNSLYIITPAGSDANDPAATRNLILRTTIDGLNYLWPTNSTATGVLPKYFATQSDTTIKLSPPPDATGYHLEFYGTFRPTPLSSTNTTTILTTYLPDVFLACSMIFLSGYQRDYGAMSDDPKLAQSWENQYQILKASASDEIARAKSQSALWSPFSVPKIATATTRGQ